LLKVFTFENHDQAGSQGPLATGLWISADAEQGDRMVIYLNNQARLKED
jgi:hypothetical protein